MPIRPATPADENAIVSVLTSAFFDEELFGAVIHPHRYEYPEDVRIFWHECIRKDWKNPRNRIIVATTSQAEQEKVVGVAVWQRQGEDEGAKKVEREWVDVGPDAFPPLPTTTNRALDPSKTTILSDSFPYCSHHWKVGDRAQNWYLGLCGIDPSYHGKGFGKELVMWGLQQARKEDVHASLMASYGSDAFYLRCGFDEVVGCANEGEGNPLADVRGGNILFMYPKGKGVDVRNTP